MGKWVVGIFPIARFLLPNPNEIFKATLGPLPNRSMTAPNANPAGLLAVGNKSHAVARGESFAPRTKIMTQAHRHGLDKGILRGHLNSEIRRKVPF